jgi:predicted phage terminase large subunit-like protein
LTDFDFIAELDERELDKELASRSLHEFVKLVWPVVEPQRKFIDNWHIGSVCEHLEAAFTGELRRLVINEPPGCMKSLAVSVIFPAWAWIHRQETRFIFASYGDSVVRRDSLKCRGIIESPWYQDRWQVEPDPNRWTATHFANKQKGFRFATTVAGAVTGEHADIQVVDDPLKPYELTRSMVVAKTALENVISWWDETMSSRLVDFERSVRIIIMQRLNEGDLAGHVLKNQGYEHLMLPMEYEPSRKCYTSIGFEDPRENEGELLWEERFSADAIKSLKADLGSSHAVEAQLQQNPLPREGNQFKLDWFQYYSKIPIEFDVQIQSWDCTFKKTGSSYVVGQVWCMVGANYYLLDEIRARMSFTETTRAIKRLTAKWPRARAKLVEAKANGDAIVDYLKADVSGLKLIEPEGGKEARASAVEPLWEAGNVWLPTPELAPWINDWVDEVSGFPGRIDDDRVDSMTQALVFLDRKKITRLKRAMENLK